MGQSEPLEEEAKRAALQWGLEALKGPRNGGSTRCDAEESPRETAEADVEAAAIGALTWGRMALQSTGGSLPGCDDGHLGALTPGSDFSSSAAASTPEKADAEGQDSLQGRGRGCDAGGAAAAACDDAGSGVDATDTARVEADDDAQLEEAARGAMAWAQMALEMSPPRSAKPQTAALDAAWALGDSQADAAPGAAAAAPSPAAAPAPPLAPASPASPAKEDPGLRELRLQVEELRARIALHGQRQVKECRLAARGAAEEVDKRMRPQLAEAAERVRGLEAEAAEQEQALKRRNKRLQELERLQRAADQRLRQHPTAAAPAAEGLGGEGVGADTAEAEADAAEAEAAADAAEHEAAVASMEARHREAVEAAQAELSRTRRDDAEAAAELQASLESSRQEATGLAERAAELDDVAGASGELRRQLQLFDQRAQDLEGAAAALQRAVGERSERLEDR